MVMAVQGTSKNDVIDLLTLSSLPSTYACDIIYGLRQKY